MTTVEELLKIESDYIEKHASDPSRVYSEEYGGFMPYTVGDNLDFLKKGYFNEHYQKLNNISDNALSDIPIKQFKLDELEYLILKCYMGFLSKFFRVDSYHGKVPQFVKNICAILDRVLDKSPAFDGAILYRFCHGDDMHDFKSNDVFSPNYNLTTTIDNWEKKGNVYIIRPLSKDKTKAKCLYKIYNHGEDCGAEENQVTFKVSAKFKIMNIISDKKMHQKKIYMDEI